jgi:hypothetical protein
LLAPSAAQAQSDDSSPPSQTVKLVFIHHSCGENWLSDDDGGFGRERADDNHFVSDSNYGWVPDGIGDLTDITDWPAWFTGCLSQCYLSALYAHSGQESWYSRELADLGGVNQIIMFRSCYPDPELEGRPNDAPAQGKGLAVGNAKAICHELLTCFASRPDKLFIAVTAPPVRDWTCAASGRAFNSWLVHDWLAD